RRLRTGGGLADFTDGALRLRLCFGGTYHRRAGPRRQVRGGFEWHTYPATAGAVGAAFDLADRQAGSGLGQQESAGQQQGEGGAKRWFWVGHLSLSGIQSGVQARDDSEASPLCEAIATCMLRLLIEIVDNKALLGARASAEAGDPIVDARRRLLEAWLPAAVAEAHQAQGWAQAGAGELQPASADASFRRYFRWSDGAHSLIIMDAPPEQEDVRPFIRIAGLLAAAGVKTPAILAADPQQGFLLLEDLGARTYLQSIQAGVSEAELERLFAGAISTLVRWQASSRPGELPDYDEAVLRRELGLFPDWFVGRHLQRELTAEQLADWDILCETWLASHLAEHRVFVHRDYMPRNLMTAPGEPGVLDFQDALYGPASYDITSLFADAFFNLPLAER